MRIFVITLLICIGITLQAQEVKYSFNDCMLNESNGNFPNGKSSDLPDCECGVDKNGLYFDGTKNVHFEAIDKLLEEDFTLSFYFRIDQATSITDIFSVRARCDFDSLIAFTYTPSSKQLTLNIATSLGALKTFETPIDESKCWHRFALTKSKLQYDWYIDDKLINSYLAPVTLIFGNNAQIAFSGSPCADKNQKRFNGWIDEFTIHRRALSSAELQANDLKPDQIITKDTTIIKGASVEIVAGPTCATRQTWSPTQDISDPSKLTIQATPQATTTYRLNIENPKNCTTSDSINIYVIDKDAVDCQKLLLPKAFTPNGDQLNDLYGISNTFLVESIDYFQIYNRSGALVWSTNSISDLWDGSFDGTTANPGTYVYKIKYTCQGKQYLKVDNFAVLR